LAIRLYHLARDLDMAGSDLLRLLRDRGLEMSSVMAVLDDELAEKARGVALGDVRIERPAPGRATEPKLPPPLVPAPPRASRPAASGRAGSGTGGTASPGARRAAQPPRPPQTPRKGIKQYRPKEERVRRGEGRGEEAFTSRTIPIVVPISLKEFSQAIGVKTSQLLLHLLKQKITANLNTLLDEETVLVLAEAFQRTVEIQKKQTVEEELETVLQPKEAEAEAPAAGEARPPIVTVLGHVDHGKTSLLDRIRKTRVAAGEAGGITQHIGAYSVPLGDGRSITFLDTPGHEAFTAMRARGARLTDIAVLVVAADDGVMPQTEEALSHARAAEVPIVVAINKCDRPDANPDRVKQQLSAIGLVPEDWGGNTAMLPVSALTGEGVPELLDRLLLEAEVLDLKADPQRPAEGYVVEAHRHPGKGVVATLLVKNGTLRPGDIVLAGACQGKVKSIHDDQGRRVKAAGPSMPVEVTGLDEVPEAGWRFQVVDDPEIARRVAAERAARQREKELASRAHGSFERLLDRIESQEARELRIVLKADVKGSLEAIRGKLEELGARDVKVKVLHAGVGAVTESDVLLAEASRGVVIGFHVVPDAKARAAQERSGVDVRTYQIIYELLDDVRRMAEGLLPTESREVVLGHAEIRQVFVFRKSKIAGCFVTDGVARRNAKVRLVRNGAVVLDGGELESLRRFKDDAREVKEGLECGLKIAGYDDIKEGDVIEFYTIEETKRTLA
jgi:translation initiation factor IF-2